MGFQNLDKNWNQKLKIEIPDSHLCVEPEPKPR
jgi:hypothetical protein